MLIYTCIHFQKHKLLRMNKKQKSEQTDNVYISPGLSKFLAISFMEFYIQFFCQICEVLSYYFAKFNSPPFSLLLVDKWNNLAQHLRLCELPLPSKKLLKCWYSQSYLGKPAGSRQQGIYSLQALCYSCLPFSLSFSLPVIEVPPQKLCCWGESGFSG